MAELFSATLRVRDKDLLLGRMIPWHLELLQKTPPIATLEALLGRGPRGFPSQFKESATGGGSYALVVGVPCTTMSVRGPKGRHGPPLNRFFSLVARGASADTALVRPSRISPPVERSGSLRTS
jgi:hypothetical protein